MNRERANKWWVWSLFLIAVIVVVAVASTVDARAGVVIGGLLALAFVAADQVWNL